MIAFAEGSMDTIRARGLSASDMEYVVTNAGDDRITDGEEYIAKMPINGLTVYARYTMNGDDISVLSGYCHRVEIKDIVISGDDTEWTYCRNGETVKKGHTDMKYMGTIRSGPSLTEPVSGESWFEEYFATGALESSERLFQRKKA